MREEIILETPEQVRAYGHPLRQRIFGLLADHAYTNKQLADLLQVSPPRLHFHLRELLSAGIIEIVAEVPKGGVIEKYYRSCARILRIAKNSQIAELRDELLVSTLQAGIKEWTRTLAHFKGKPPEFCFVTEQIRVSPERLQRINTLIKTLNDEILGALQDPDWDSYPHHIAMTLLLHSIASLPNGGEEQ